MDSNPRRSTPAANKTMCFTPKIKKIELLFRFRTHMHMLSIELSLIGKATNQQKKTYPPNTCQNTNIMSKLIYTHVLSKLI